MISFFSLTTFIIKWQLSGKNNLLFYQVYRKYCGSEKISNRNNFMIIIIDFGSQFNQLIARRVREHNVYCQVEPSDISVSKIRSLHPQGIILSGGPSSIYEDDSPSIDKSLFDLGVPILGICYGMHYMVHSLGGKIKKAEKREYGFANLDIIDAEPLFKDMGTGFQCWMSHGDSAMELPENFVITASTENTPISAIAHHEKKFYGLQFHPESFGDHQSVFCRRFG